MLHQAAPDQVIIPDLDTVRANAQNIRTAFKNRAFTTGSATVPTSPTNSMSLIVAAALLNVKAGGIFDAKVAFSITGLTAADTMTVTIQTQTVASGIVLSNATKVGPGMGAAANGAFVSNAVGGITVAGGGGTLTQFSSGAQVLPTGGTTFEFAWDAVIQNSISATTETGFTLGNQILLTVATNSAHQAAGTFAGMAISLVEQPA